MSNKVRMIETNSCIIMTLGYFLEQNIASFDPNKQYVIMLDEFHDPSWQNDSHFQNFDVANQRQESQNQADHFVGNN